MRKSREIHVFPVAAPVARPLARRCVGPALVPSEDLDRAGITAEDDLSQKVGLARDFSDRILMSTVLAVGGAGYIGTHVSLALLEAGHDVIVLDDLSNSRPEGLRRVERLAGRGLTFRQADMTDAHAVETALGDLQPDSIVLLAGLKSVGDSTTDPLTYFRVNVGGAATILTWAERRGVRDLVFSSSATVYSPAAASPVSEAAPQGPINPYGETKLAIERMLDGCAASGAGWRLVSLRYFNPVGAHVSGLIGENPLGTPTNLFPLIAQVAGRRRQQIDIFGGDYPTRDGTGVRDFIHIEDLAQAHVAALAYLPKGGVDFHRPINVGTGAGASVQECLDVWAEVVGHPIPARVVGRRPGDLAESYADATLAHDLLSWRARHDLKRMCEDHWRFQQNNPFGYPDD